MPTIAKVVDPISLEELEELASARTVKDLAKHGGVKGVCEKLGTEPERGLTHEEAHSRERIARYGANRLPEPPTKSFISLVIDGLKDKTLVMLIVAATVSLALGIAENPTSGWIEGTAILAAVTLVVMVSSANDYHKEQQFRQLNARKNNKPVKVMRSGGMETVSVYDVVVGDIVEITTGDILCADGLWISGFDMKIDESVMTGESDALEKNEAAPFLIGGTQVLEGMGRMVVTAVGTHSTSGKTMMFLAKPSEDTPLQQKLERLADQIAKFGIGAAIVILVSLVAKLGVGIALGTTELSAASLAHNLVKYLITSITVVVVAVPEGLPLAVTIALAYSMTRMLKDANLVRHLEACETMGGSTTICSDKTGTLTTNRMTVVKGWVAGTLCNTANEIRDAAGLSAEMLWDAIAINTTASEATNEAGVVSFVGSKTECALLGMLKSVGHDYAQMRHENAKLKLVPFSSARKRASTVARVHGREIVFTTGASEIVLARCTGVASQSGTVDPLIEERKAQVLDVISNYASQSLRTIALAYRPMQPKDGAAMEPAAPADFVSDTLENGLTLLGIVGIKDPLREEVKEAVANCRTAGIMVRMLTGDNIVTAKSIARECQILTDNGVALEGPDFAKLTDEQIDELIPKLQVIARCAPTDKQRLVRRLMEKGEVVAVTGDGTNDAPALREAHVGFAMGITGTEVSKEASDIILMDDNFGSIVKAAMWGRNVYDSIRKFLQFQLTVNFVAVLIAFVGAVTSSHGEPPLKPVQMLWVNMIMDTMAALALATDVPSPDLLKRSPYGKTESLITKRMLVNVVGQAIYQVTANLVVLYLGPRIFGVEAESTAHLTCVFNVFVLCQLFNEINSRVLTDELNVFKGFFRNVVFVGIMTFTVLMQFIMVQYGGDFASTAALTGRQWLLCVGIASIGIPVGAVLKFIPATEAKPTTAAPARRRPTSAVGAAGWAKLRAQKGKISAVSAFRKAGLASVMRREHRILTPGFACAGKKF